MDAKEADVLNKIISVLAGPDGKDWLRVLGQLFSEGIDDFFPMPDLLVLGEYQTIQDYIRALNRPPNYVSDYISDCHSEMLNQMFSNGAPPKLTVRPWMFPVSELGFSNSATRKQIVERLYEMKYGVCSIDFCFHLLLKYRQPPGQVLNFFIPPVVISGESCVLKLEKNGGKSTLSLYPYEDEEVFGKKNLWVCLRP